MLLSFFIVFFFYKKKLFGKGKIENCFNPNRNTIAMSLCYVLNNILSHLLFKSEENLSLRLFSRFFLFLASLSLLSDSIQFPVWCLGKCGIKVSFHILSNIRFFFYFDDDDDVDIISDTNLNMNKNDFSIDKVVMKCLLHFHGFLLLLLVLIIQVLFFFRHCLDFLFVIENRLG